MHNNEDGHRYGGTDTGGVAWEVSVTASAAARGARRGFLGIWVVSVTRVGAVGPVRVHG
jgi:hypothetical protein